MSKIKYLFFIFFSILIFIFIKIYQHNQLINLNYKKQKNQKMINELKKEEDNLLIYFYKLKDQEKVKLYATEKFGMVPIKLSQIITNTTVVNNFEIVKKS
ncbi:MAG: hypothetical protein WC436_00040 [Candidatus Babeliales bacterium]